MNNRQEKALALHDKGYNCCQAVALAFSDCFDVDREALYKLCEGFGFGMGNSDGVCGALSGAVMLAGLKNSDGNTDGGKTKRETYKISAAMYEAFAQKAGSVICRTLKGKDNQDIPLYSCNECITTAVEIAQKILETE